MRATRDSWLSARPTRPNLSGPIAGSNGASSKPDCLCVFGQWKT